MDGEPLYAINYQGLIPHLVAAIQEQDEKIEANSKKSLTNQESSKLTEKLTYKVETQAEKIEQLETQIAQLVDCTNCDDIEIQNRKINLQIDQLDMILYPNPARDFVNLEINSSATGLLEISVFNESGQLVSKEDMMLIKGSNVHRMDAKAWTPGMYYVTTTFDGVTNSKKVVIE